MAIKLDPSSTGRIPREALFEPGGRSQGPKRGTTAPADMRAMEKPETVPVPRRAATQQVPRRGSGAVAEFQRRARALSAQLRARGPERLSAADQALALAASYSMRRSKGSRRHAIDLLEEVAEEVEERAELARELRHILLAEGYLHRTSADATLRAIRALVGMLTDESEQT